MGFLLFQKITLLVFLARGRTTRAHPRATLSRTKLAVSYSTVSSGGRRGTGRPAWRGSSASGMTGCRGGIIGDLSREGDMEGEDPDQRRNPNRTSRGGIKSGRTTWRSCGGIQTHRVTRRHRRQRSGCRNWPLRGGGAHSQDGGDGTAPGADGQYDDHWSRYNRGGRDHGHQSQHSVHIPVMWQHSQKAQQRHHERESGRQSFPTSSATTSGRRGFQSVTFLHCCSMWRKTLVETWMRVHRRGKQRHVASSKKLYSAKCSSTCFAVHWTTADS